MSNTQEIKMNQTDFFDNQIVEMEKALKSDKAHLDQFEAKLSLAKSQWKRLGGKDNKSRGEFSRGKIEANIAYAKHHINFFKESVNFNRVRIHTTKDLKKKFLQEIGSTGEIHKFTMLDGKTVEVEYRELTIDETCAYAYLLSDEDMEQLERGEGYSKIFTLRVLKEIAEEEMVTESLMSEGVE